MADEQYDYSEQPNPTLGEPSEPSLALERYLTKMDPMIMATDEAGNKVPLGDIPPDAQLRHFGGLSKAVPNSNLTEKDIRARSLWIFRDKLWHSMFQPVSILNADGGRKLSELNQIARLEKDLITQARDGMHSKQRTTSTSIHMAGRLENMTGQPIMKPPQQGGQWV